MWSVVCYPSRDLLMRYRHVFGRIAIITGQPHLGDLWYLRKSRTVEWFERPVKLGDVVGIHDSYFRIHTFHSILNLIRLIEWSIHTYFMLWIPFQIKIDQFITILLWHWDPTWPSPWKHPHGSIRWYRNNKVKAVLEKWVEKTKSHEWIS